MSKRRGVYNEELVEKMQCGIAGLFNDWYNNAGICGGCASCKNTDDNRGPDRRAEA